MTLTLTATELASAIGVEEPLAARLLGVADAMIERYAPGAPSAIKNESAIRFAGWLSEAPSSGARREDVGDISTSYSPTMTSGFRTSGALALLAPWIVHDAGVAG